MSNVSRSEIDEQIGINDNCNFVTDNVHDIFVNTCGVEGIATKKIPCVVKVFGASTKGVSCNVLCNSNTKILNANQCDPVFIFKLARFIFPKQDPSPTEAGLKEISDFQSLEYLVNIAGHKLNWDLKQDLDSLCNLDTSYPEITSSGVLSTQYDLKQEINAYKRSKEKERYVVQKSEQDGRATTILNNDVSPSLELTWSPVKKCAKNSVDASRILASDVPIFNWPTSGPLPEIVDSWQKEGISLVDGFNRLIQERKNNKHTDNLLAILKQIKNNFSHKKGRKKVNKFIKLVSSHKDISLKRSVYFVYWFYRIFMNVQGQPREINVSKFDASKINTNCEDKDHQSGTCPELIIKREGATSITSILMDTGAESNILGLEALEQVLQVSREEITPLGYNLSLRGTTGLRCNAILGRVTVSLSFLLEASQKNAEFDQHKWVTSKVTFLVADPSVNLRHIIVGIPFLRMHFVSLHFNPRPKVSAMFSDAPNGRRSRVNLKLKSDTVKLHLSKPIKIGDETASFWMTNLVVEDDFVSLLNNNTNLKLPSHIVFNGFLRSDGEKSLLLNKNLELPVWTETECDKVTLLAEVVRIPQASKQRIHGSDNNWNVVTSLFTGSSDSNDQKTGSDSCTESQSTCHGLQVTDKSEIENLDNLKYSCNLGSLPLGDQQRILNSSNDFYTNVHGVEVEDLETYSGRTGEAEIDQDVRLCSICNVFKHKCACSILCSICNEKRSDKISCKCDCQHVRLLATKINRSLSGGSEEQCGQENYIPASE